MILWIWIHISIAKKVIHDLLNFTSQGRRRLHKGKSMSSKQLMIRGNLLYIPLIQVKPKNICNFYYWKVQFWNQLIQNFFLCSKIQNLSMKFFLEHPTATSGALDVVKHWSVTNGCTLDAKCRLTWWWLNYCVD